MSNNSCKKQAHQKYAVFGGMPSGWFNSRAVCKQASKPGYQYATLLVLKYLKRRANYEDFGYCQS